MSQKACPNCDKSFSSNQRLRYHVDNNVCMKRHRCDHCSATFSSKNTLNRHVREYCKEKVIEDEKNRILNLLLENQIKLQNENSERYAAYERLLENQIKIQMESKNLKDEIERMKTQTSTKKSGSKKIVQNMINNQGTVNINNGEVHNYYLVGYGKEDLDRIDKKDLLKGMRSGFNSTLNLIDAVHFNPKYPEFHNVYISSMKNKYAMMYDGNDWTLVMKDYLIDKLYDDKRDFIDENLDEFLESLTPSQQRALNRWLNVDDDHHYVKKIKNDIKLMLYNKRRLVINNPIKYKQPNEEDLIQNAKPINDNRPMPRVVKNDKMCVDRQIDNKIATTISDIDATETKGDGYRYSSENIGFLKSRKIAGRPGTKRKIARVVRNKR